MTKSVGYTTKELTAWNEKRQGEIELDARTRAYLGDAEITDRDRIAFALRELRKRGYDVEDPIDWTKPLLICSVVDSEWWAFGKPWPSKLYRRLDRIARRLRFINEDDAACLIEDLYPERELFDQFTLGMGATHVPRRPRVLQCLGDRLQCASLCMWARPERRHVTWHWRCSS